MISSGIQVLFTVMDRTLLLKAAALVLAVCVTQTAGQSCVTPNGTGKCASNVFTCAFQNGYPHRFTSKETAGDCGMEEICCVSLPKPQQGACASRCGLPGSRFVAAQPQPQRNKTAGGTISLDSIYDWGSLNIGGAKERSARIVNGTDTEKYEFCWQGGVFVVDTEQLTNNSASATPIYIGGVSLISEGMALTAAHVLQPFITNSNFVIFVAFGFRDITAVTNIMNASASWDELPVLRVPNEMAFHSEYNDRTYENNIAIIKFNPISCATPNICPICLSPTPANPYQPWKGTCYAAGWGATANKSVASTSQKLEMVIPYPNECLRSFEKLGLKNYSLPSTMLCADAAAGSGGTCDRDGGSPLVCQTKYGNWELTGIVGVGINKCRQIAAPTLFTNVGYYYEWIQSYSYGSFREWDTVSQTELVSTTATSATRTLPTTNSTTLLPIVTQTTTTNLTTMETFTSTSAPTTTATQPTSSGLFVTPKIFVPNNRIVLSGVKKQAQAFFQERSDVPDVGSSPVQPQTKSDPAEKSFSVIINDPKASSNTISGNSGAIKFFMMAQNPLIKRKPHTEPPSVSQTVAIGTTPASTATVTGLADRSLFIKPNTTVDVPIPTTSVTTQQTTLSSSTTTATTTITRTTATTSTTTANQATSPTTSPTTTTGRTAPTSTTDRVTPKSATVPVTNSGFSKIYIKIRPQDNAVLSYLKRKFQKTNSGVEITTEAPTSPTIAPSTSTSTSTSSANLITKFLDPQLWQTSMSETRTTETPTTVATSGTAAIGTSTSQTDTQPTSTLSSSTQTSTSTPAADLETTTPRKVTFERLRTEWFTRPTGPSIML